MRDYCFFLILFRLSIPSHGESLQNLTCTISLSRSTAPKSSLQLLEHI